jgi:hypothetical protein
MPMPAVCPEEDGEGFMRGYPSVCGSVCASLDMFCEVGENRLSGQCASEMDFVHIHIRIHIYIYIKRGLDL